MRCHNRSRKKKNKNAAKKLSPEKITKDSVTKKYMSDPKKFADAFNFYLYHGEQVIRPEMLHELDTTELVVPYGKDGAKATMQRYRDELKLLAAMSDGNRAYCVFGIENQSEIHYAMPVKNGLYDFMQLSRQVTANGKSIRKEKKKTKNGEYLSNFRKEDKLLPVVTLVIYFGADKWDAPLTLREMYTETDETILKYAPDYRINLITPESMSDSDLDLFQSDLYSVMKFIKHSNDKEKLRGVMTDKRFKDISREALDVINTMTNSEVTFPEGEEESKDMCEGLRGLLEDEFTAGKSEGRIEGEIKGMASVLKELNYTKENAYKLISQKHAELSEEAMKIIDQVWAV